MLKKKRHSPLKILRSPIFLIISLIVLVLLSLALIREFYDWHQVNGEIESLEKEIDQLEGRNNELLGLIQYFKTDSFVESEGRTKLGLQMPGESLVIIPDENSELREKEKNNNLIDEKILTNAGKWWKYFFN